MSLQPHQQRVIDERDELQVRADALERFILGNPIYPTLPTEERRDLSEQLVHMRAYLGILNQRIKRFSA